MIKFTEHLDMSINCEDKYSAIQSYELKSIAVHLGTINGGHYVAYCKKEDEQWYCMDDERVGRVARDEVLR
jgi:ubiquitin C-terminal hydrolase